jgi:hypothetical protein
MVGVLANAHLAGQRVDAVRLAAATVASARPLDLDHRVSAVLQLLAQARAPAANALDTEHDLVPGRGALGPALQLGVAPALAEKVRSPRTCPS